MLKDALLNKGWGGRTITRQETLERLNVILRPFHEMTYTYDVAIERLSNAESRERLKSFQRTTRADGGKLAESVLSSGGVPESGVDMELRDFDPGNDDASIVAHLIDLENALLDRVAEERKVSHRMHTRAVLGAVEKNAKERLDYLKSIRK